MFLHIAVLHYEKKAHAKNQFQIVSCYFHYHMKTFLNCVCAKHRGHHTSWIKEFLFYNNFYVVANLKENTVTDILRSSLRKWKRLKSKATRAHATAYRVFYKQIHSFFTTSLFTPSVFQLFSLPSEHKVQTLCKRNALFFSHVFHTSNSLKTVYTYFVRQDFCSKFQRSLRFFTWNYRIDTLIRDI
jgi:hypothetical protein